MADEAPVRYEAKDGVATITLDRPDVLNAMNNPMRAQLLEIFARLRTDDTVKAVVVTGAGERAFWAGADIREFLEPPTPTHFREARKRLDFRAEMERCPQAIIAAIRGFALGGGLELALACDIRIAAEDAQLGLTEINLAIIPGGGGTQRLPRLVGRGKALEMILTGMRVPAAEALRIGLVERVVPVAELMSVGAGAGAPDRRQGADRAALCQGVGGGRPRPAAGRRRPARERPVHAAPHHRGPRGRRQGLRGEAQAEVVGEVAALSPPYDVGALGATDTPRALVFSMALATRPEAFASSTKPRR